MKNIENYFQKVLKKIIINSKEWEMFLKFMAYSPYELENQILIYAQNPKVSYPLFTKKEWEELKREIKSDSKGITIVKDNIIQTVYSISDTISNTEEINFEIKENSFPVFEWNEDFLKKNKYGEQLKIDNSSIDIFENIIRNSINFIRDIQLNSHTTEWKNKFGDIIYFNNPDNILLLLVIIQNIMTKLVIKNFKIERKDNIESGNRNIREIWKNGDSLFETTELSQIYKTSRTGELNPCVSKSQSGSGGIIRETPAGVKNQTTSRNSRFSEELFSRTSKKNICGKGSSSENSICREIAKVLNKQEEIKKKSLIPMEIKNKVFYHGLGTTRSKQEITSFFNTHSNKEQRLQFLKSFYYFYKEYFNFFDVSLKEIQSNPARGIKIIWEEREKNNIDTPHPCIGFLTWDEIEEGIEKLIKEKRYLEPYYYIEETHSNSKEYKRKNDVIKEKNTCKYFLQNWYNEEEWFKNHIYNREEQEEYTIIELKKKVIEFWEDVKKTNFTKKKQEELKRYYDNFVKRNGRIRTCIKEQEDPFLYKLEYENENGEIIETDFFTHFFVYSPKLMLHKKRKKKKNIVIFLKDLEKQDILAFAKESLKISITEDAIKKDSETGYWLASSFVKKSNLEEIIFLETVLNNSGTPEEMSEIQEKFKNWIKKYPEKQKYYNEKVRRKIEEKKKKLNSVIVITDILEVLLYFHKIEHGELEKVLLVVPEVVAKYIEETYLSFYPTIHSYYFISPFLYKENYKEQNIIFLTEEQFNYIPAMKKEKELKEIHNRLEILNRYIYMEEHLYKKNNERIKNLQKEKIRLRKEQQKKEKRTDKEIFTLEEFSYNIILKYKI